MIFSTLLAGVRRRVPAAHLHHPRRGDWRGLSADAGGGGPVTVSGQHHAWLIPLLETGWVAYLSTTDAVCYHDGHRALDEHGGEPITKCRSSAMTGLRDAGTIRVTDMGFDEQVLLDQDRFLTACLMRPEFQKKMTGTELRSLLGIAMPRRSRKTASRRGSWRRASGWRFRSWSARRAMAACF